MEKNFKMKLSLLTEFNFIWQLLASGLQFWHTLILQVDTEKWIAL